MPITLKLTKKLEIPIEADSITPTNFVGKTIAEIEKLPIIHGNQTKTLSDFFKISGKPASDIDETVINISGDLRKVKLIGKGMNGGKIEIDGDVGAHLGAEMIAGRIHVNGSVSAWAGAEMEGGNIQIEGDAADYLCAGYQGSKEGMKGGRVYVAGNVGREMASHMRKGFIAVKGNVGEQAAVRMMGGTIIVVGNISGRLAFEATKGMVLCLGKIESLLPTFKFSGTSEREFTNYYLNYLKDRRPDFLEDSLAYTEKWIKFMGDLAEGDPKEEIYVLAKNNEHLI